MPHSHLRIQHFLKALELRRERGPRIRRPEWIFRLIDEISELFEPYEGLARVGYDCRLGDDRWEIGFFLGRKEIVGGSQDGSAEFVNFQFDLLRLFRSFNLVETFEWHPVPQIEGESQPSQAFLFVEGYWQDNPVRLYIYATPPDDAGPGVKQFPDGHCEPA